MIVMQVLLVLQGWQLGDVRRYCASSAGEIEAWEATMANRIDVHSHFLPSDYLAALRNAGNRLDTSPQNRLRALK